MEIDKKRICDAVVKLQNGDGKAFEELYNLTYNTARFTAIKITKNEQDAEDVLQEAYIKVLEKINTLDKPESFMSWFNMIVANKARDVMRKSRADVFSSYDREDDEGNSVSAIVQLEDDNSEYVPGDNVEKEELRKDVMKLIDGLSEEKRAAVILYYYNELSIKQIAEALKISEGTVKSRLFNAKKEIAVGVEMLKKKGKVFGVAPIPLVIWALKASSVAAGTAYTAAGAAAVTLSAVTAGSVAAGTAAGTGTAVAAGTEIAAKIAAAVVAAAIIGGGAVVGSNIVKNRNKENVPVSTTSTEGYSRSTPKERYGDVTIPEGKNTDILRAKEEAKYGVEIGYQDFAVRNENGVEIVESTPVFSRGGFKATYDELLPAAISNKAKYSAYSRQVVNSINSLRVENGLTALTVDNTLTEQANVRAEEIAWSGRNNAIRPDGTYYTTVFDRNGLKSGTRVEIISYNYPSVAEAILNLEKDKSITSRYVEKIGVGTAENPENGRIVFVAHLYSDRESLLDGFKTLNAFFKNGKYDLLNIMSASAASSDGLERVENAIGKIPIVGDILLYDFDNDTQIMEFSQAMDRLAERIIAFIDSIRG